MHGEYEYERPDTDNYSTQKIRIKCIEHGWFKQRLQDHRRGSKCPRCNNKLKRTRRLVSFETLLERFRKAHGIRYEYDSSSYFSIKKKMRIKCGKHGWFLQKPDDHQCGHGCPKCKSETLANLYTKSFEEFVKDARKRHGNKYIYHEKYFTRRTRKVKIECRKHGLFECNGQDHIYSGSGCRLCSVKQFVSTLEKEWLNSLGLPNDNNHRQVWVPTINGKKKVDGYDPITNTVYLFHGDYWHGNPRVYKASQKNPNVNKSFGNLFEDTKHYENEIRSSGYNLTVMWESDYRNKRGASA